MIELAQGAIRRVCETTGCAQRTIRYSARRCAELARPLSERQLSPVVATVAGEGERDAGRRTIIFPTLMNVRKLGRSTSVAEAFDAAGSAPIVTVFPQLVLRQDVRYLVIPAEADYGVTEIPVSEIR